jgi:hypothetical protein
VPAEHASPNRSGVGVPAVCVPTPRTRTVAVFSCSRLLRRGSPPLHPPSEAQLQTRWCPHSPLVPFGGFIVWCRHCCVASLSRQSAADLLTPALLRPRPPYSAGLPKMGSAGSIHFSLSFFQLLLELRRWSAKHAGLFSTTPVSSRLPLPPSHASSAASLIHLLFLLVFALVIASSVVLVAFVAGASQNHFVEGGRSFLPASSVCVLPSSSRAVVWSPSRSPSTH